MPLNQLDPNLVRSFDERDLGPAGDGAHTLEDVHALAPEPVERRGKIVDAKADMVDGPPARGLERFPGPSRDPATVRVRSRPGK